MLYLINQKHVNHFQEETELRGRQNSGDKITK